MKCHPFDVLPRMAKGWTLDDSSFLSEKKTITSALILGVAIGSLHAAVNVQTLKYFTPLTRHSPNTAVVLSMRPKHLPRKQ